MVPVCEDIASVVIFGGGKGVRVSSILLQVFFFALIFISPVALAAPVVFIAADVIRVITNVAVVAIVVVLAINDEQDDSFVSICC